MGRSQVLYNRRKGRGGGGGRNSSNNRGGTKSDTNNSGNTIDRRQRMPHTPLNQQPVPKVSLGTSSSRQRHERDYEEEYEVLFAGRDTYRSSNSVRNDVDGDDDDGPSLVGGTICIPSMAATLEKLSMAKRLKIPVRVAAKAFPSRYRPSHEYNDDDDESERAVTHKVDRNDDRNEEETAVSSSAAIASENAEGIDAEDALEDWLDDACGTDTEESSIRNLAVRTGPAGSRYASKPLATTNAPPFEEPVTKPKSSLNETKPEATTNKTNDALAKAAEEFDEDNLDDWLDSVI